MLPAHTFLLVLWAICLAIDVAGLFVTIRLWRRRSTGAPVKAATVYLAATAVLMLLALVAVLAGLVKAFGAVGGESVDPSQKARILAEGISEALNTAAFGTFIATPLAIAMLFYAWLRRSHGTEQRR